MKPWYIVLIEGPYWGGDEREGLCCHECGENTRLQKIILEGEPPDDVPCHLCGKLYEKDVDANQKNV